ncbi:MAG: shikimate kinase [Firmicutes bacterium]|nr:shikimate kinase [Bacillota bacterium]
MPGAGKSTLGVLLAKVLGMSFVDTDLILQEKEQRLLQEILDQDGVEGFLKIEEEVLLGLQVRNCVIATGGSAVYSQAAMQSLQNNGIVVYIKVSLSELEKRLQNMASRGVVMANGESLKDLYDKRTKLYEHYADCSVDCTNLTVEKAVTRIIASLYNVDK